MKPAGGGNLSGFALLVGGVLFTFQIYCDFSGYSDIAIGCARLFGFDLMRNFNYPYFSRSIPEFWRRWHISLTTWFRDYIYFPLGGSRYDKWRTIRNVYIVWGVSGLWHGANWTFICWGVYHGSLLAIYNILGINTKYRNAVAYGRYIPSIKELLQIFVTFFLAVIGWIIFRAESIHDACLYISTIFNPTYFHFTEGLQDLKGLKLAITAPAILSMIIFEWIQRNETHVLAFKKGGLFSRFECLRIVAYIVITMVIIAFAGSQSEFIYFQF